MDVALASPVSTVPTDPAALQLALQQAQGGMQKSWPGSTVIEQRPITTGPLTGREFIFAAQGDRVVIARRNPLITQFMDSLRFG